MTRKKRTVYLDYAATTPIRKEVLEKMLPVLETGFGNPSSVCRTGVYAKKLVEDSRKKIADAINADPKEIYFTAGGSESNNWAIKGTVKTKKHKGNHVVASVIEHPSVYNVCKSLGKQKHKVSFICVDNKGIVDPEEVEKALTPATVLVSVMTANNEIGSIQPITEISRICNREKVVFHTDAVQALGSLNMDVKQLGADLVSFSGHKIYGPKGVGALYIKKGTRIASFIEGGAQENNKRAGTENVPYIVGFAEAVELACKEQQEYAKKLTELKEYLIESVLSSIPYVKLNGHRHERLPGNINFSFKSVQDYSLLLMLDEKGFECSNGAACSLNTVEPSRVLLELGVSPAIARGSIRVSLGKHTKKEDLTKFVSELKDVLAAIR